MADYKGKFTGQQVDDTLQQSIDDHKKMDELYQRVEDIDSSIARLTKQVALTQREYDALESSGNLQPNTYYNIYDE